MPRGTTFTRKLLQLGSVFLLFAKLRGYAGGAFDMQANREKMAAVYLKAICSCRLVFLSAAMLAVAVVLLLCSFILAHVVIFVYAPWSPGTKIAVGLAAAFVYLLIAAGIFYYIFDDQRWLKIFHARRLSERL